MNSYATQTKNNKAQAAGDRTHGFSSTDTNGIVDNRPEAVLQRKYQQIASNQAVTQPKRTIPKIVNTNGIVQRFVMSNAGIVGSVSLDAEEGGVHHGHTIARHVVSEQTAAARLADPAIPASGFWSSKDDAHNAFKSITAGDRSLKHWAGQSDYNPAQTQLNGTGIKGANVVVRNGGKTKTQKTGKVTGFVAKPNNNPFTTAHPNKTIGLVTLYPVPE